MKKILVVDDEPDVIAMLRDHFSLRGYEVHTANDGRQGIELARQIQPDVVILDLKMKQMDGDEAVPLIKQHSPQSRMIMVSAYQDETVHKRLENLPIDAYYEKPVSILTLQKTIEAMTQPDRSE